MSRWIDRLSPILLCIFVLSGCMMPRDMESLRIALDFEDKEIPGTCHCTLGAHRGDSGNYLENSPQAIVSALQNPKYAFIEFDVQYSADDIPVVFHDSNLLRLFGHLNKVRNTPLKELRELSDGAIATYDEIMKLAEGKPLNIEIKSQGSEADDEQLIDHIVADVTRRGIEQHILISSISEDAVKYVKSRYPHMAAGQIFWLKASTYLPFDFLTEGLYRQIDESHADFIMLHLTNRHNIKDLLRLKPKGKTIIFWNLDDTMYLVHKDHSDRLWGDSAAKALAKHITYHATRPFASNP